MENNKIHIRESFCFIGLTNGIKIFILFLCGDIVLSKNRDIFPEMYSFIEEGLFC